MVARYITFANSSCDIQINVNMVRNCCRNLAVRGLNLKIHIAKDMFEISKENNLMVNNYK